MADFYEREWHCAVHERFAGSSLDVRALAQLTICCIGPRTARGAARMVYGRTSFPSSFRRRLIKFWPEGIFAGRWCTIPRALISAQVLPEQLRKQAEGRCRCRYTGRSSSGATEQLMERLQQRSLDAVVHQFVDGPELCGALCFAE
ncbi:MAG: uroporphyrinogen-III synthase [Nitrospiraceae bacterium]